ncbi:MAG: DUF2933 domain-containing protein [Hyphomicrobiaceae bacterium]|nr:DUF2933 domain-containing protein [Hyphomicrobiaceae bacterium]
MGNHDHSRQPQPGGFWRSRMGIALIAFLAAAGLLLTYEHRLHIFTGNAFLVVLLVLCIGMHFLMHGGRGGHGGHGDRQ